MRDVDLYTQILGIQAPWQVTDVEVDMPQGQVTVHVEREAGGVCQDSCPFFHAIRFLFSVLSTASSSRAGLSQTTSFLDQSLVGPDQRSGRWALACS